MLSELQRLAEEGPWITLLCVERLHLDHKEVQALAVTHTVLWIHRTLPCTLLAESFYCAFKPQTFLALLKHDLDSQAGCLSLHATRRGGPGLDTYYETTTGKCVYHLLLVSTKVASTYMTFGGE